MVQGNYRTHEILGGIICALLDYANLAIRLIVGYPQLHCFILLGDLYLPAFAYSLVACRCLYLVYDICTEYEVCHQRNTVSICGDLSTALGRYLINAIDFSKEHIFAAAVLYGKHSAGKRSRVLPVVFEDTQISCSTLVSQRKGKQVIAEGKVCIARGYPELTSFFNNKAPSLKRQLISGSSRYLAYGINVGLQLNGSRHSVSIGNHRILCAVLLTGHNKSYTGQRFPGFLVLLNQLQAEALGSVLHHKFHIAFQLFSVNIYAVGCHADMISGLAHHISRRCLKLSQGIFTRLKDYFFGHSVIARDIGLVQTVSDYTELSARQQLRVILCAYFLNAQTVIHRLVYYRYHIERSVLAAEVCKTMFALEIALRIYGKCIFRSFRFVAFGSSLFLQRIAAGFKLSEYSIA